MRFKIDFDREPVPLLIALLMLGSILAGILAVGSEPVPQMLPVVRKATPTAEQVVPDHPSNTPPTAAPTSPPTQAPSEDIQPPETKPVEAKPIEVNIVGPEEIIFDWSVDACDEYDLPDTPARVFRDSRGQIQLLSTHHANRRMVGPDFNSLVKECEPVMRSDYDPDPAQYNDREWIAAPYTLDGTTVYSLIHNEYQGHQHPDRCPSGQYRDCWFNSITLGFSTDAGDSYSHAPPPAHLVAAMPYPYAPGEGPAGLFNPSNIVYHPGDGYYYVLFRVEKMGAQPWGVCVMRTNNLADPTSWRAWDGKSFSVTFVDPYRAAAFDPAAHTCAPVSRDEIERMSYSVTYNTYFQKFLLIGPVGEYDPATGEAAAGIYYSLSDDLIHWSPRALIMQTELTWTYTCGEQEPTVYPVIVDHASPSRNFDVSGQQVYLYFTRFHYQDCKSTLDRDLVRLPIRFE